MNTRNYFESIPTLDITAAHIGINVWSWDYIPEENINKAKEKMAKKKYDVLPIMNKNEVTGYYSIQKSNDYENINYNNITDAPTVYYRTSIQDLLNKLIEENRRFFFLKNNLNLLGLVSTVNFSSQLVYNYFYHRLSELERNLVTFFDKRIDHDKLIKVYESHTDSHFKEVYKTFSKKREQGLDNIIYQYFDLQDYAKCIAEFDTGLKKDNLEIEDNVKEIKRFKKKFGPNSLYTKVRNTVAHPSKGFPNEEVSIKQLNEFLADLDEINSIISMVDKGH